MFGKRSPTVSPWAGMNGPLGDRRPESHCPLPAFPVLTGRLMPAHGASVGKVQQKSPCVPTGRFIETLASCGMIFGYPLMKRPVGTRNVWGKRSPTVSPWAEMDGHLGTEGSYRSVSHGSMSAFPVLTGRLISAHGTSVGNATKSLPASQRDASSKRLRRAA